MIKILTLLLIPYFSFSQMQKKMGDDPPPCPYPTLGDVVSCGNETQSSILVGALQSLGDINIGNGNGTIELYNNGNIICRDASGETCIFIVASDGTISMRNMTATNAEVELKYAGTTTTTAVFTYKQNVDTVAYRSDIPVNLNQLNATLPIHANDSVAGANGLTTGKMYLTIVSGDAILKVKQ